MSTTNFDRRPRKHPSDGGVIRMMARSGGYVMARRPRKMPFVLTEKQWMKLEVFEQATHPEGDRNG